jgi:hypothetical protein
MDIVMKAPPILLYICAALIVVTLLSVLLKKGAPGGRIAAMAIVVMVCGALLFFFYRDRHFIVDDQGIRGDAYGKISVPWADVRSAFLVDALSTTAYAIRMKTNGLDAGPYRMGWFRLANGQKAYVVTESGDRALVIETADVTYVFGMKQTDALAAAVAAHVTVAEGMGVKQ